MLAASLLRRDENFDAPKVHRIQTRARGNGFRRLWQDDMLPSCHMGYADRWGLVPYAATVRVDAPALHGPESHGAPERRARPRLSIGNRAVTVQDGRATRGMHLEYPLCLGRVDDAVVLTAGEQNHEKSKCCSSTTSPFTQPRMPEPRRTDARCERRNQVERIAARLAKPQSRANFFA